MSDKVGNPAWLWLRLIWHTRPGHASVVLSTRRGLHCSCGRRLDK